MKVLIAGTGRSGTLSLTKWFNELFENNHIKAKAVHEYLSKECYAAVDEHYKTSSENSLKSIAQQFFNSNHDVVVGNGYALLLPFIASIQNDIILIHLQRRDRNAWIASSARNAKFYPFAYKYYVSDEISSSDLSIPRTAAFHVGQTSFEEWSSWNLEKKLSWHYDYIHQIITQQSSLFPKNYHFYTEDLNSKEFLEKLAQLTYPQATNIPSLPKLNSHFFADIESYPPEQRRFSQWLLGKIDWQQAVNQPEYFVTYAMQHFESLMGWCKSGRIHEIFPEHDLDHEKAIHILRKTLPKLKKNIRTLNKMKNIYLFKTFLKKLIHPFGF